MFVQDNSLSATQIYFSNQLQGLFSEREVKTMFEALIKQRLNWTSADFLLHHEARLSESDLLFIRSAVKRLLLHEPFQYVIGNTEFYGLSITCAPGALIPRPETEELVDWILEELKGKESKILDIGTGSGCIAISLSKNLNNCNVLGWDINEDVIKIANQNAIINNVKASFEISDITKPKFLNEKFDVLVSNPPYITNNEKKLTPNNVKSFEPHSALFVEDDDPLFFYKKILEFAIFNLKSKLWVVNFLETERKNKQQIKKE